jgi:hypothetical protein
LRDLEDVVTADSGGAGALVGNETRRQPRKKSEKRRKRTNPPSGKGLRLRSGMSPASVSLRSSAAPSDQRHVEPFL